MRSPGDVRRRVVIMGAAGRDFHNFNVVYRGDETVEVVAFTAAQIPFIAGRAYPVSLAGPLYPRGIPIVPEDRLGELCHEAGVSEVVFAYSDVTHEHVMHAASLALAAGADFRILGPRATMLPASVPVVSVGAARTGAGKSPATRRIVGILRDEGLRTVVVRHPMPYGDLERGRMQRFATLEDLDQPALTIEEREEYEPHVVGGTVVYAGIDYGEVLEAAEVEADVIVWEGGNNDFPFYRPDLHIVALDALRAGHETRYHPGEANVRMADVILITKVDTASEDQVLAAERSARELNSLATVIRSRMPISVEGEADLRGKAVLVVEDGPTLSHGEMSFGAGAVAARRLGAAEIVDPRPHAVGLIQEIFGRWPGLESVLPAVGYSAEQVADLAATIERVPADVVVIATPVDLRRLLRLSRPVVRVTYELEEIGPPDLASVLEPIVTRARPARLSGG